MLTFFCPICWGEIKGECKTCPCCGADIKEYEKKGFEEKLINALRHPEPETVLRAVCILGKLRSAKAVRALMGFFKEAGKNPFLKIEILKALKEIGGAEALQFLKKTADTESGIVGKEAKKV